MILETMTAKEAATALGVNISAVYQAVHSEAEDLQAVRCGKQIRLLKSSVEKYRPRSYGEKRREEGAEE